MRKTLGIALALALIVPGPASAELFNNLKISGSLDIQNTSARNVMDFQTNADVGGTAGTGTVTRNDRIGNTLTRTMLQMDWDLLDDVHAQVGFMKNDRAYGTTGPAGNQAVTAAGGHQTITATGGADVAGNIAVHLANVKIDKLMGRFDVTLGRQHYGEPGDLMFYVGARDTYGLFVQSMDAVRVDMDGDMMNLTGIAATFAGPATIAAAHTSTYLKGLNAGWKNLPLKANTYVYNRTIQGSAAVALNTSPAQATATSGPNDNLYVYGVKLRGEAAGGWLSLDAAGNLGEDRSTLIGTTSCIAAAAVKGCNAQASKYRGYGFLLDAGYNAEVANIGGFTPWGTFGFGSGRSSNMENKNEDFTMISTDFRPGVINRRFAGAQSAQALGSAYNGQSLAGAGVATTGLTNRVVWGLGLNFTPAMEDRMTIGLSFWDFRFQRATQTNSTTAAAHGGNKHIGSEVGLTTEWRHSENVTVGAGWATFQPGGFVKEEISGAPGSDVGAGNDPASMFFADFTVKF